MVLPMYLGDYVQESVHGKDPLTSTYGHNCAKYAVTCMVELAILHIYDQKV